MTNPPFGSGHDLRIKETSILEQYKNGHQWEISKDGNIVYSDKLNDRNGIAPELLFLEKCLNWVKNDVTESIEQLEKSISAGNIAKTTLNEILE